MASAIDPASLDGLDVGGCYGVAFQSSAHAHHPLTDRLDFRGVPEREELFEQRAGAAVRQQGAHLGEGAFILRRAAIRHDLRGRVMVRRDALPADNLHWTAPFGET
jgi:hypothetical protein